MHLATIKDGVLTLNYPWLPMWLGMNNALLTRMEKDLAEKFVSRPITKTTLFEVDAVIREYICTNYPLAGLDQYLRALSFVKE